MGGVLTSTQVRSTRATTLISARNRKWHVYGHERERTIEHASRPEERGLQFCGLRSRCESRPLRRPLRRFQLRLGAQARTGAVLSVERNHRNVRARGLEAPLNALYHNNGKDLHGSVREIGHYARDR